MAAAYNGRLEVVKSLKIRGAKLNVVSSVRILKMDLILNLVVWIMCFTLGCVG